MSYINYRALNWARGYETQTPAERAVLFEFAIHADERGYTWKSVSRIAREWHLHDETVTRAIRALIKRRAFSRTKKREGTTGRVVVYRLPKITWVISTQSADSNKAQISGQSPDNIHPIRD